MARTRTRRVLALLLLFCFFTPLLAISAASADGTEELTLSFWTGYDAEDSFRLGGLLPGDKKELIYEITVKSKSAKALAFDIYPASGDIKLTEALTLRIEAGTGTRNAVTYTTLYDGGFDSFDARDLALTGGLASQTVTYRITLGMLTSAGNEYADLSLKLRLEWRLGEDPADTTDTESTKPDTTEPKPDTTEPKPDTTEPKPDTTEPKPDTTEPEPDTTEPEPDTTEPEPDTTEPEPDTTEPEPDTTEPEPDTTEPEPDTTEPEPDTTEPIPPEQECDCIFPWCHTDTWGCLCPWCWIVPLILLGAVLLLAFSIYEDIVRRRERQ